MYSVYNQKKEIILESITYKELVTLIKEFKNDFENETLAYSKRNLKNKK